MNSPQGVDLQDKRIVPTLYQDLARTNLLTMPAATDTLVGKATTDVFTNKTLTAPVINGEVTTTGLTLPAFTLGGGLIANFQKIWFDAGVEKYVVINGDTVKFEMPAYAAATWIFTCAGVEKFKIANDGVLSVQGVQVVGVRIVDARADDVVDATYGAEEAGVLDALRDAMIAHGLIAAA